jgi:hypothetical protein
MQSLFSKLPRLVIRDGTVTLPGKRFNIDRSLYAYGELIDTLSTKFGDRGMSKVDGTWDKLKGEFDWPHPDKERVLGAWRSYAKHYEALGGCVTHRIGPLCVRAYVLGRNWTVYHPESEQLLSANGGDPLALDHAPCVEIGGRIVGGELTGLNEKGYDAVRGLVFGPLAKFGLNFTTTSVEGTNTFSIIATLHFPHGIYGAGEDWIRVRCLAPGGEELIPANPPS